MENRYEIHYDEIIPGTSCTYRSNGCTIIPLRIIRIRAYTRTTYDRPYATLTRHGGHMLGRASNTTTSDAIDTYPSKSPLHARERLQQLSVSPSLIPPSIPAISFWKRRVVDSFPLLLLSFPVTKLAYPLPHQPSFSTTIRSCLFDFPSNSSSYRFFPSLERIRSSNRSPR